MVNIARKIWGAVVCVAVATVAGLAFNQETTSTPLVSLPNQPLYLNGGPKAKTNLVLTLSVETPTVGTAYPGVDFDPFRTYVGYYDHMVCYTNASATDMGGEYFTYRSTKASIDAACPSGQSFDGNFLNWATTSAIDILRYGLTGGNRVVDEGTGAGRTVLERAYLPDSSYAGPFFPTKYLRTDQIAMRTPFAADQFALGIFIRNCRNRVYFATEHDGGTDCGAPFGVASAQSDKLVKQGETSSGRFYQTRVLVCDPPTAANRPMVLNPDTGRWSGLCLAYRNASGGQFFKPVGQLQVNADNVRVSVFSYLQDNSDQRYGGVMRAPLKYLGARQYDSAYNLMETPNPHQEWDPVSGVFITNPQAGSADYGPQGYPSSGVINYLNRFGTLNPNARGSYKDYDPLNELYYEAVRYLQGKQPTPEAWTGINGTLAHDKRLAENFPVYTSWTDPHRGFVDIPGPGKSCLRNNILAVADVFTHLDRYLPGNTKTDLGDSARPVDSDLALDVQLWTDTVGSFEANMGRTYTDSRGRTQRASNIAINAPRIDRDDIATRVVNETGARGSYLMAGLAYFVNTQSFRTDLPKARISTYAIDVNTHNFSTAYTWLRQGSQMYLAAKYGGFDDSLTGNTGNPYAGGDNLAWQRADGDARNYFVVSDPQVFLNSIAEVFHSLANETSSIAGGATSSNQLLSAEAAAVFQGGFNPAKGDWSGTFRKFDLTLSADASTITVANSPSWEAGQLLTMRTRADQGVDRNIVVGAPLGQQGTEQPSPFEWNGALADAHKTALNKDASGNADTLGSARLAYLRGDSSQEQTPSNTSLPFRPRRSVLGSVVNAGVVYQGAPSSTLSGTSYSTFSQTNKDRTPVVFVNANDGMLHAFRASDGREAFAYLPGFIVPRLNAIPDINYTHHPLLDATPTVAEAQVGDQWRSVLVSGTGAGVQGIFALDVTDPDSFTKDSVLWEFTDADHPAMGNVLGKPRIARVRMNNTGTGANSYKWMVIVPSGVNNHRSDASTNSTANPSIFLIDLEATPSPSTPWREGVNFWRIELPPGDASTAPGLIQITTVQTPGSGNLEAILAGDLQGNVWNLSFRQQGASTLTADGLENLERLNAVGENRNPMFIAKTSGGVRQPITSAPLAATGFGGKRLVLVGTGKFLETTDISAPVTPASSLYVLLDNSSTITDRTRLQSATIDTSGGVSVGAFQYGTAESQKEGWVLDFPSALGERQVSEMLLDQGNLVFSTLRPSSGVCGEGGGRGFNIDVLSGRGSSWDSSVGVLGGPMLLKRGNAVLSTSNTSGRRTATYRMGVLMQGSKGMEAQAGQFDITLQVGRMSWRQVHNHGDLLP